MQYISDGSMKLDSKTQFEAYHLAVYLQVESLQQFCLDRFTFALSRSNVESQLDQLENHCLLNKKFKKRALMFKDSRVQSFSGFYFLQNHEGNTQKLKVY